MLFFVFVIFNSLVVGTGGRLGRVENLDEVSGDIQCNEGCRQVNKMEILGTEARQSRGQPPRIAVGNQSQPVIT
jgi:hypothetical protein